MIWREANPCRAEDEWSDSVVADLDVRGLLNFETAADGSAVRLIVEDVKGQQVGIVFTTQTITALLMTLPAMASSALRQADGDPSMRVTYPLSCFQIEQSSNGARILTIGTPDGFSVTFSLTEEISLQLGEAHLAAPFGGRRRTSRFGSSLVHG